MSGELTEAQMALLRRAAEPGVSMVRGTYLDRNRLRRKGLVTVVEDAGGREWARITDAGRRALKEGTEK